jgi:hypothetical protein
MKLHALIDKTATRQAQQAKALKTQFNSSQFNTHYCFVGAAGGGCWDAGCVCCGIYITCICCVTDSLGVSKYLRNIWIYLKEGFNPKVILQHFDPSRVILIPVNDVQP